MGLFHCIESSCARVEYREYLPPVIRWRYPEEEWQEIEADDYQLEQLTNGQCDTGYNLRGRFEAAYKFDCRGIWEWYSNPRIPVPGAIIGFEEREISGVKRWVILYSRPGQYTIETYTELIDTFYRTTFSNKTNCSGGGAAGWEGGFFSIDTIERADGQADDCTNCIFTITKKGEIVYKEIRPECPEVEQLPCRLSGITKVINIEKLPLLERVELEMNLSI